MSRAGIRWIVCWVILSTLSLAAQSPAADPISGTWTGSMGPNDADRHPITMDLKFDGTTITGRITGPPYPGEVTSGSFDAKTGALKLDVIVKDEDSTRVSFEGTVKDGTATGHVQMRNQSGTFTITKKAQSSAAATDAASTPADEMKASFEAHKGDFDYLLGDWTFTADHKGYGTFGRVGSEIRIEHRFGVAGGKPSTSRIRYFDIQPDRFSWTVDRSVGGGKTWTEKYEQIEAKRIGAPRGPGPLAMPKKEARARSHR